MMSSFVNQLISADTNETEFQMLKEMKQELLPLSPKAAESEEDVFEKEFLIYAKSSFDDSNPFPSRNLEKLLPVQDDLNKFTCYLFERRYGWSEIGKDGSKRVRHLSCGSVLPSGNVHHKALVNDILDDFLKWYQHQSLSLQLLKAYLYTLSQVSNVPVVRNQTYVQIMQWFKKQASGISKNEDIFDLVKSVIVSGVTDIWSAIRSSCASRLTGLCSDLPPQQLQKLFTHLSQICVDPNSPWQSVEGAVLGLAGVIKGFRWKDLTVSESICQHSSTNGNSNVDADVPCSSHTVLLAVSKKIKDVIFPLLSHPQLTIRENATKTLASYLTRNNFKESLACFEHVCGCLCEGTEPFLSKNKKQYRVHEVAHEPEYKFLDAYAAEGLLGVCVLLVKRIPVDYLLPQWPYYLSTFLLYLMHPASTVRQATSSVFKYLVSKGNTNPVFFKLVLSELLRDWTPDMSRLNQSEAPTQCSSHNRFSVTEVSNRGSVPLSSTWEWREGRLFAYELILKFAIKNHWLYTFGPAVQVPSSDKQNMSISMDKEPAKDKLTRRISEVPVLTSSSELHEKEFCVPCPESASNHSQPKSKPRRMTRVMTSDSLLSSGKASSRPYSPRSRLADAGARNSGGMISLFGQLQKLEHSLQQINGVYQNKAKASEKEKAMLMESLQQKDIELNWLSDLEVEPMSSLITRLFYQISECIMDSQWELRRMGLQTLPCLSEMMRWYDMSAVISTLNNHLSTQTSPLTYSSALVLRDSLLHASTLQILSRNPPSTWQDQDRCKDAIVKICCHMQDSLESFLPVVLELLTRGSNDKLSVTAACCIMMSVAHFHLSKPQKSQCIHHVLEYWRILFCLTHPKARFTGELDQAREQCLFKSPYSGYLSCCLVKPDGPLTCAKQVEKTFMGEIQGCLVPFVKTLSPQESTPLLPILTHLVGVFAGDSPLCKVIIDSLSHISSFTVDVVVKEDCSFRRDASRYVYLTLKELTSQIASKTLDLQIVRRLLDIYVTLSKAIVMSKHLPTLLGAICARINQTSSFMVQISPRPTDDLSILSNDIPPSAQSDVESEGSDIEDLAGPPSVFPECFALNISNNSGSFASGRLSALSTHSSMVSDGRAVTPASSVLSETEQHSDWDTWSDEEEDASAVMTVFRDFFGKLKLHSGDTGSSVFQSEIEKLCYSDRQLILSLVNNHL